MSKSRSIQLDFVIDKLTNSIENRLTGEVFQTFLVPFTGNEKNYKKKLWHFDWKAELKKPSKEIYKLIIPQDPDIIQGLICFFSHHDHIFMDLIESAVFNQGEKKLFEGVPGNLVAFACKSSFERGYQGVVAFKAKSVLVSHYEQTLKAKRIKGNEMFIDSPDAYNLVKRYFKNF